MSNWDWLAKAVMSCWAISIVGKLTIAVASGMSGIRGQNFFSIFDLVGLVAVVLTIALLVRRIVRRI